MSSIDLTAREELYEVASQYKKWNLAESEAKKKKDAFRTPLLDLITEVVDDEVPLRTIVEYLDPQLYPSDEDVESWRAIYFPEYEIVDQEIDGDLKVSLKEDPTLRKFRFIYDGNVFGRTFSVSGESFKAKDFLDDIPFDHPLGDELAGCIKVETVTTYTLDEDKAKELTNKNPDLRDLFQDYTIPGKLAVKLLPITKAKGDELEQED